MEFAVSRTKTKLLTHASARVLPLVALTLGCLHADTLFVGFNTQAPVQLYGTDGSFIQNFGPDGAIAVIPVTSTSYFAITPGSGGSSTITSYSGLQAAGTSFTINNLIVDGAVGPNNSLWLSAYDGTIYQVSQTGTVETSWSTGYSHVGVASDGTYVYTTEGDGGSSIDKWTAAGKSVSQIATQFFGLYGLGYNGSLWAGSSDFIYDLGLDGSYMSSLDIAGIHDGLELGPLPTSDGGGGGGGATPEPASIVLIGGGLLFLAFISLRRRFAGRLSKLALAALSVVGIAFGSVSVRLTPSIATSAPVGTTVTWTVTASDSANAAATFNYQFSVAPSGGALQVKRDYSPANNFPWTEAGSEGTYSIQASVKSSTGAIGTVAIPYSMTSRVTGSVPVVSSTKNSFVALYSVPPCPAGHTARVRFKGPGDLTWQATPYKTCTGSTSLNFYVAGMRSATTYSLQQDVYNGPFDTVGPVLTFTTGTVPSTVIVPANVIDQPASAPNNLAYNVVLYGLNSLLPFATDTKGNVIWYLADDSFVSGYLTRPVPGGTFLCVCSDNSADHFNNHLVQEFDLAGNLVRETNYAALTAQVNLGSPVTGISHEIFRYPNGDTGLVAYTDRAIQQGGALVDVASEYVIVLDSNFQVKWSWSMFDHLDTQRKAILNEVCQQNTNACPQLSNGYTQANDWTHSNSLAPTPDGNLILSVRHQDWVIKINYANGTGDGRVLWKFGRDGDFKLGGGNSDPNLWPTHQHDAEFEPNGLMSIFDNGNTRVFLNGSGNSRGQAWSLDQTNLVATPVVNIDLGTYSFATGSAQLLSNGNYHFFLGFAGTVPNFHAQTVEYTPAGALKFQQEIPSNNGYRSFRMHSLYSVN